MTPISGQTEHGGVRGNIVAYLGSARTRLQIDMGFGDIITGGPIERPYRTLLGNRRFSILTYPDGLSAEHWASAGFATEWSQFLRRIGTGSPEFHLLRAELLPRLRKIYQSARAMIKEG